MTLTSVGGLVEPLIPLMRWDLARGVKSRMFVVFFKDHRKRRFAEMFLVPFVAVGLHTQSVDPTFACTRYTTGRIDCNVGQIRDVGQSGWSVSPSLGRFANLKCRVSDDFSQTKQIHRSHCRAVVLGRGCWRQVPRQQGLAHRHCGFKSATSGHNGKMKAITERREDIR